MITPSGAGFEAIFRGLPGSFVALRPDAPRFTILGVSDDYLRMTRTDRRDLVGRGLFEASAQDESVARPSLERVLRRRVPDQSGAVLNTPVLNADGSVQYVVQSIENRRRESETHLRERHLLETVLRATDVMLVYLDTDFNFVWVNEAYANTCNYRAEEMVGRNHFALYPHSENETIFRRVRDKGEPVFEKDKPFDFPDQPERGRTYWDWSLVPVKNRSGEVVGLVLSLRETTRYVHAEAAFHESEERFRLFMNNSPTIVWIKDEAGRHVYLNRTYEERFGVRLTDWRGKTDAELWPEETAAVFRRNDLAVLAGDRPVEVIEETINQDGNRSYWLNCKFPFRNANGKRFVAGIGSDITALRQAQYAAEAANEAKDRFLAIASHELRTPLAAAIYATSALHMNERLPMEIRTQIGRIDRNLELERRLIDDLLDVGRITSGKLHIDKRHIDVAASIHEAARILHSALEAKDQSLDVELSHGPYPALADAARLQQVFWNLLQNASKFSEPGARIAIRAHIARPNTDVTAEEVVVDVIDTGRGIDPKNLPDLFDAFVQEEAAEKAGGLGLGLSICRAIVELHGGTLSACSEGLGRGAKFSVRLPLDRGRRSIGSSVENLSE